MLDLGIRLQWWVGHFPIAVICYKFHKALLYSGKSVMLYAFSLGFIFELYTYSFRLSELQFNLIFALGLNQYSQGCEVLLNGRINVQYSSSFKAVYYIRESGSLY